MTSAPGDRVRVTAGPLAGTIATVVGTDELPGGLCLPDGCVPVQLDPGARDHYAAIPAQHVEPVAGIDYRAAFERELGLTIDLDARGTLLDALRLGPDSPPWRDAMAIIEQREITRAQMASPSRERRDLLWHRIDVNVRRRRHGRLVTLIAPWSLGILIGAVVVLAGIAAWRWL